MLAQSARHAAITALQHLKPMLKHKEMFYFQYLDDVRYLELDYSKRPKLRSIDVPGWSWSVVAPMVRLSKRSFQSSKNLISRIG